MSSRIVLDASALLALLFRERGYERVDEALSGGVMSAVNLAEVTSRLLEMGADEETTRERLEDLPIEIIPFNADHAYRTGILRAKTKKLGLSLGDRACLATAAREKLPVLTADKAWRTLKLDIHMEVIR
ncbi:MAG: type II toxin-antitoxin system VapC family toxin [Bryobacteraceae bacterium]